MDEMDDTVGDILRRVSEWREKFHARVHIILEQDDAISKGIATELAKDLQVENFKQEEHRSTQELIAFFPVEGKFGETMARLSRFFNENVTRENVTNLPEVGWWKKLKKLFEIEESFYKQSREAFATKDFDDFSIYSGLAREALQQIWDSIEKEDKAAANATTEKNIPTLPNAQTVTERATRRDTQQTDSYSFKLGRLLRRLIGSL